jgi:hypothetical protein
MGARFACWGLHVGGGLLVGTHAQRADRTFECHRNLVQAAERYGLGHALSRVRFFQPSLIPRGARTR